jgi:hypothetical protein
MQQAGLARDGGLLKTASADYKANICPQSIKADLRL